VIVTACGRTGVIAANSTEPNERAGYHFAPPIPAAPGEALGESVNLIVVATGKSE